MSDCNVVRIVQLRSKTGATQASFGTKLLVGDVEIPCVASVEMVWEAGQIVRTYVELLAVEVEYVDEPA